LEEEQRPQAAGEPVPERARIAGVEAGVAAGLVPSGDALARPGAEVVETSSSSGASEPVAHASVTALSYDLPDWTDPPTLQVPRVFLDLEQEAAAARPGPPTPPPGGPVWRERQEDWNDTDAILGHLASAGPSVTDYEEPSSDDPFAYDFLDLDDDSSWITREEEIETQKAPLKAGEPPTAALEVPVGAEAVEDPGVREMTEPAPTTPADFLEDEPAPSGRRHRNLAHGQASDVVPRSAPPGPPGPRRRSSTHKPAQRNPVVATLTGVGLAAVLLLCFMAGPPAVLALAAVAVTLATAELFNSLRVAGYKPATLLGLLGVPAVMVGAYFRGPTALVVGLAGFIVVTMLWYLAGITRRSPVANLSVTVMAFCWTGVLGGFAGLLLDPAVFPHRHGIAFMLGAVIAAVGYDIGGYAIGSRFGRHNLAPTVSPNKTWEGLIGGCAIAIAASGAITSRIHPWHVSSAIVLGLIVAVVAPCGDLVESMIKRDLGVKDMGSLLPGHGGMMDRIDALLFVLPAAYCFVRLAHIA
jgi:phosphatidate cytidylyltransferase